MLPMFNHWHVMMMMMMMMMTIPDEWRLYLFRMGGSKSNKSKSEFDVQMSNIFQNQVDMYSRWSSMTDVCCLSLWISLIKGWFKVWYKDFLNKLTALHEKIVAATDEVLEHFFLHCVDARWFSHGNHGSCHTSLAVHQMTSSSLETEAHRIFARPPQPLFWLTDLKRGISWNWGRVRTPWPTPKKIQEVWKHCVAFGK